MPVIAIGLAGAAIGAGVGAAAGLTTFAAIATAASIGFSIGTLVGQQIFPEQIKQEGSRVNDLLVTSSAFGSVRPIVYGRVRIAGNVIWATPIKEVKTTKKSGKGGMSGPSVTSTTYTYFGNFAVALCEGPVDAVTRVWADSKLIFDMTGGGVSDVGPGGGDLEHWIVDQTISSPNLKFRFYPGDEEQQPDPLIEADKGEGNVPGYRGTCYVVFEDLPLINFSNRLPNITCEVVKNKDPAYPLQQWVPRAPDSIFGDDEWGHQSVAVDWDRGLLYWQGQNPMGIKVVDARTLQTIREVPMTEVLLDGTDGGTNIWGNVYAGAYVGPDGALYFLTYGDSSTDRIVRVDQNTLRETASFPLGGWVDFSDAHFGQPTMMTGLSLFTSAGTRQDYLLVFNLFTNWGVLSLPDMSHVAHGAEDGAVAPCQGACQGIVGLGVGEAWVFWGPGLLGGPVIVFQRIRATLGTFTHTMFTVTIPEINPDPTQTLFRPAEFHLFVWDEVDNSLIFTVTTGVDIGTGSNTFMAKWTEADGIVWSTALPNIASSHVSNAARITGGTVGFLTFTHMMELSTATGAIVYDEPAASYSVGWDVGVLNSIQLYDSQTRIMLGYYNSPGHGFGKAYLNRGDSKATTLGDIVADQCLRAGLLPEDFEVTDLTDVIEGYVVSQRASGAGILTPLFGAFLVDAFETDFMFKFVHRGGATVAAVTQDDLIREDKEAAEPYVETRQQEIELPMRLTLTYIDRDRDYQMNVGTAKRIRRPDPTVYSDNQVDLQFSCVMTQSPAKQMAEKLLYTTWNERHVIATRLSPEFDYLDPSDVVQLTLSDGYTARMRISQTTLGVDYSLETRLIGETDGQYESTAEADPGVPWLPSHFIFAAGPSQLIMLDTPLLRDVDDLGGRAIRGYWAGGPYSRAAVWPGAVLQTSLTGDNWTSLETILDDSTWGYIDQAPADWEPLFASQDELHGGTMVVGIIGGGFLPSSVSDEELASFANPMILIKENGQVEVIQYRDAAALGDGRWRLSHLRRGQRGSDTMAFGHRSGEIVVFLDDAAIEGLDLPLVSRNVYGFYRLVTVGMIPDSATRQTFTYHARDLMPYAPVNARRSNSGSDGVLTWTRRTRMGGMLEDGTDTVPLNEASEAYEVYLLPSEAAAAGFDPTVPATYRRAYTGLTAPTLTYTAAEMATDGFVPATDTVWAAIYQISGVVGRGFSSLHVLPPLGALAVSLEDGTGEWNGWTWG